MNAPPVIAATIGAAELQKLLTDVEPAALLVPPRLLRRIIKEDCRISGVGLQVPHRKTFIIHRDALLGIVDRADLGLSETRELPERLILLACPEAWIAEHSRDHVLVRFWRLLFHARIDQAIEASKRSDDDILAVLQRVGFAEAEEAFRVLRHENFLLPPEDLHMQFREFVALFLELRFFARPLAARYFPAIDDPARAESILGDLVNAADLFHKTRLAGAPDPVMHAHDEEDEPAEDQREVLPPPRGLPSAAKCQKLLNRADLVAQRGNVVRAAILRLRAADVATPEQLDVARQGALHDLDRLVKRLQAALELHDREANEWLSALRALLGPASRGIWPPSARLLYDLQKVCVDHERDLYALDLVEWGASFCRKPVKRPVPLQADVLLVKHLRSAAGRLARARISDDERRRLAILLRSAIHHCEERLREKIRPLLTESLEDVGLRPETQPEHLSQRKIVEELLDRVTERGFLNMGDVRDAVSRNQLKLPDMNFWHLMQGLVVALLFVGGALLSKSLGAGKLIPIIGYVAAVGVFSAVAFRGDRLLRANRKLALTLDGVYHRGEIYMRGLQRASSLLFGTLLGRWLTLYVILPFGGSYATIIFWDEMVDLGGKCLKMVMPIEPPTAIELNPKDYGLDPEEVAEAAEEFQLSEQNIIALKAYHRIETEELRENWQTWLAAGQDPHEKVKELLVPPATPPKPHAPPSLRVIFVGGVFLFLVMHVPPFRRQVWEATKTVWKLLRLVFFDAPRDLLNVEIIRRILQSDFVIFLRRRIMLPLLLGLIAALLMLPFGLPGPRDNLAAFGGMFLLALLVFSSRFGRRAEDLTADWLARNWYWLRVGVWVGLAAWLTWFFKEVMDRLDRVIYTVDEWLRFRPGDNALALVYKPVFGLVWFLMTYLIRMLINVFIEPSVNPIKHFPAVTVTAKLLLPVVVPATQLSDGTFVGGPLAVALAPLYGLGTANTVAGLFLLIFPGLGGFLVWELKENWKLYRANRKKDLRPVMIGSHGETMLRFMKPGFHSGTLPKLFAKLRRAERRGDGRKIHKQHEALHHVVDSIRHFVERDLLLLLEQSRSWGGLRLLVGEVKAATNRVRIEVRCPDLDETGFWLLFEERCGWLLAAVQKPGWLGKLNAAQTTALKVALAGLYKKAGVHLVREQVEASLSAGTFTLSEDELLAFRDGDPRQQERHPLHEPPTPEGHGDALAALTRLRYDRTPVDWDDWVRAWEDDRMGSTPDLPLLHTLRLLPTCAASGLP